MSYLDPSLIHPHQGAVYGSAVVPQQYQPFSVPSHLAPHVYSSASPEDYPPAGPGQQHPSSGKVKTKGAYKESPVKAACLTCRAKKAKCDGVKPICGACSKKSLECQYVKSRRGGARKKREVPAPSALQEFLKKLDGLLGIPDFGVVKGVREPTDDTTDIVREFSSREEIFRCYYNEVHPFLPVMPVRKHLNDILPTLLPVSPFLLAAQAILVLVPHPRDPEPNSADSKRLRSAASHSFAEQATEAVERLIETHETSLESVQALTMLALWEWGCSGSVHRNRARTTQASQLAMEMSLHDMDKYSDIPLNRALEGEDWQKDMARRTWWITYVNQLISSIITGGTPVLSPDDERIKVHYPVCSVDDQSWPRWIETNRQCTRVFGIVNSVYYSHLMPGGGVAAWGSCDTEADPEKKAKMRKEIFDVDAQITEMMRIAEETAVIELVPGGEEEVVRNQQLSSRLGLAVVHIHIHRHQAFPEVSLFSKMICGLPKMPDQPLIAQPQQQPQLASIPGSAFAESQASIPALTDGSASGSTMPSGEPSPAGGEVDDYDAPFDFIDDMWQPETFPETLPDPWFSQIGGAGALYAPVSASPTFLPPVAASITSYHSPEGGAEDPQRRPSVTASTTSTKPHKAWGVDENDKPDDSALPAAAAPTADPATANLFPPGVSLARCATAAHTIVRLEVLHRSAVIAMWDGPPKWMPFCACGLVTGAYSFLLLALAVQAESLYTEPTEEAMAQIEGLLTNVKVIVAGLEAYGTMWSGIEVMASEVRAALEAAIQLPVTIRQQLTAAQMAPQNQMTGYLASAQTQYANGTGSANGTIAGSEYALSSNGTQAMVSGMQDSLRITELSPGPSEGGLAMSTQSSGMGSSGPASAYDSSSIGGMAGSNGFYGLAGPVGMGSDGGMPQPPNGANGANGAYLANGAQATNGVNGYGQYDLAQLQQFALAQQQQQQQQQQQYPTGNTQVQGWNGSA